MKFTRIIFLIWTFTHTLAYGQGLQFIGGHQRIEDRTSLQLFTKNNIDFTDKFEVAFDLSILPSYPIGYILRIKNENIDRTFNLFYDEEQDYCVFRLNEEGKSNLITSRIKRTDLVHLNWFKVKVIIDMQQQTIGLYIHNTKQYATVLDLPTTLSPKIIFGKSDYLIDLPNFSIKNLIIGNKDNRIIFPFRENDGNEVHNSNGKIVGSVSNPIWLINNSYRWKFIKSFNSSTQAGSNYNTKTKEIYYFNKDSIIIYNVKTKEIKSIKYSKPCPLDLVIGMNFIDYNANKLYIYETHHTGSYDGPSLVSLDLKTYTWKIESHFQLDKELHHHGYFYNASKSKYTIFGGYGRMRYSDKFYSYQLDSAVWKTEDYTTGAPLFPRYFLSMGLDSSNQNVYIFGGMGNESGEHIVGRRYYYDLHKLNLNTMKMDKLWDIGWKSPNMIPGRGLIIADSTHFYTLGYPEHVSDSFFKLYKFSIQDGSYQILGDSVPILSDKITTRVQLYYDEQLENLYAVAQESKDDISSTLKIYTINFPPLSFEELGNYTKLHSNDYILILIGFALIIISIIYYVYYIRQRKRHHVSKTIPFLSKEIILPEHDKNAIYLFGDFKVLDRAGKDKTHLFSTRIKQTLCVIFEYGQDDGITSKYLSSLLWPEKSEDKVKNSRGVTINHLRKALSELDGFELQFEKGKYKIVRSENAYCDFMRCIEIIKYNLSDHREELIHILKRGPFLQSTNDPIFDNLKTKLERQLETTLSAELEKIMSENLYYIALELADILLKIDPINDFGLSAKIKSYIALKQHVEARATYQSFVVEYKKMMNENYPNSYEEIIKN